MGIRFILLIFIASIIFPITSVVKVSAQIDSSESLLISEIQTGGCSVFADDSDFKCSEEDGRKEFIELKNTADVEINLDGWRLDYISSSGKTVVSLLVLDGYLKANSYMLIAYDGFKPNGVLPDKYLPTTSNASGHLPRTGGHVQLVLNDEIKDLVGWGTAQSTSGWHKTKEIPPEFSVKRLDFTDPAFTINKQFSDPSFPTNPVAGGYISLPENDETGNEPSEEEVIEVKKIECEEIIITEILPNPSGDDTGKEFIEIYNPTDKDISLHGCALSLDKKGSARYDLSSERVLSSGEYRAYYDSQTKLKLTNSTADKILFISGQNEIVYTYEDSLKDDIAWALIDGGWQQTNVPTPGAANKPSLVTITAGKGDGGLELEACPIGKYRNPETNRCKNIATDIELTPCKIGQERNPETNRCRNISAVLASLTPCKAGQERNPETNRCRNTAATLASLTPCKADQERNPETNRCRKISSIATALKPCKEGQERNPETNRCRKVASVLAAAKDSDDGNSDKKNLVNYGLIGIVGLSVLGYGIYEYRNDFRQKFASVKSRFSPKNSSR